MKPLHYLLLVFAGLFASCTGSQPHVHSVENTAATRLYSLSCDSVLHLLVISANIPDDLKDKLVAEDGVNNDTLLIKISHRNEAEPGAFVDAADGFLCIDLKNKNLFRVAIETDSLIAIHCDQHLLAHYIVKCAGYISSVP